MTTEKILAAAAEILGLEDVGELKLAARERLAAKQATQHAKPPQIATIHPKMTIIPGYLRGSRPCHWLRQMPRLPCVSGT